MPIRALPLVLLLLSPQDRPAPRDSATARIHDLGAIIDEIAREVDRSVGKPNERALVCWMIDNASSLKATRHGELLSEHIARAFAKQKAGVHHAVLSFAERPQLVLKATADPRAPGRAIEWLAHQKPDDKIKNCLENLRTGAAYAAGFGGRKFLVVFTPENADNEDNVEATLKLLRDAGVVLYAIADEAIYSDPYWAAMSDAAAYRKLKFEMTGPDSAVIEFPHGWLLQTGDPTYTVPSGFGFWALNRLATYSDGRYFIYSVGDPSQTFCFRWGCTLCGGQHKACGASFDETKLRMTAPCIESRDQARDRLSKEKLSVAVFAVWEKLYRAGLVRSSAPLKVAGAGLAEAKPQHGSTYPLAFGVDWRGGKGTCRRLLADLDKVIAEFSDASTKLGPEADKRALATADALLVHLRLLRLNIDQLRLFCEELEQHEKRKHGPDEGGFGADGLEDS